MITKHKKIDKNKIENYHKYKKKLKYDGQNVKNTRWRVQRCNDHEKSYQKVHSVAWIRLQYDYISTDRQKSRSSREYSARIVRSRARIL